MDCLSFIGVAYRSLRASLVSVLPNTVPILVVVGVWNELVGTLDLGGVAMFSTVFGILVDDTVHIMDRYRRARLASVTGRRAIGFCITSAARPLLTTTCLLSSGFAVLSFSSFLPSATLGATVCLALWVAILFDFVFFLPTVSFWEVAGGLRSPPEAVELD